MSQPQEYLSNVRDQYEDYPYPYRDPQEEKNHLTRGACEAVGTMGHFLFNGKLNIDENFHALVAGGGTGDAIVYLAEQLRDTKAQLTYLDLSSASMEIAKERLKVRGIDVNRVNWHHASILDIPKMKNFGPFDYINCCGVLHHLESPLDGLNALKNSLKPNGGMGLMVYAPYGRTAVYLMQDLLRSVNEGVEDIQQKIDNTKIVISKLQNSHIFKLLKAGHYDIEHYGDIGIYDLLLHTQDRSYSVSEIYEWVEEQAGMKFSQFMSLGGSSVIYDPKTYLAGTPLVEKTDKLSVKEKAIMAEKLNSQMITHEFFVSNKTNESSHANVDDLDMVPFYSMMSPATPTWEEAKRLFGEKVGTDPKFGFRINAASGVNILIYPDKWSAKILGRIDSKRTLKEIYNDIREAFAEGGPTDEELHASFKNMYEKGLGIQWILLRHKTSNVNDYYK